MEKNHFRFITNLGLLVTGLSTVFSGLLIQVEYHIGNHGNITADNQVFGMNYYGWLNLHKISIVLLSLLMICHFYLHWKWYKAIIKKRLLGKNIQVLILSVVFILAAITGLVPWFIYSINGSDTLRKFFVEIHDKITLILLVFLILHVAKRLSWFIVTLKRMMNN